MVRSKSENRELMVKTKMLCLSLGLNPCKYQHFKLCMDMVVINKLSV